MPARKTMTGERSRMVKWQDPAIIAHAMPEMSGLDLIRSVMDGKIPVPPILNLIGFQLSEVEEGRVVFVLDPAEYHYNPAGAVHGGVTATVLDSAATWAVYSTLPAGMTTTTLEIKINYLRPVRTENGPMRCEAGLVHKGNRIVVAEAKMADSNGLLYAYAVSTCLVFEATKGELRQK